MPASLLTAPSDIATSRIAVYRYLMAAFESPSPQRHAWLNGPEFRRSLELACDAFGLACPEDELFPDDYADHESRQLACFDVGVPVPPVPLLASHYNTREPAPRVIHEHILFYRRFGMSAPPGSAEPADHLLHELAFLIHLDGLLSREELERESIVRGRRDFLARQASRWPPRAFAAAEERGLPAVYCSLLAILATAVHQDLSLTEADVAALAPEES